MEEFQIVLINQIYFCQARSGIPYRDEETHDISTLPLHHPKQTKTLSYVWSTLGFICDDKYSLLGFLKQCVEF